MPTEQHSAVPRDSQILPCLIRPSLYLSSLRTEVYKDLLDEFGITHILQVGLGALFAAMHDAWLPQCLFRHAAFVDGECQRRFRLYTQRDCFGVPRWDYLFWCSFSLLSRLEGSCGLRIQKATRICSCPYGICLSRTLWAASPLPSSSSTKLWQKVKSVF
jgi:hypothetical protein